MKNIIWFSTLLGFSILFFATDLVGQAPSYFNYQAIIRGADLKPLPGKKVSFKTTILEDSEDGTEVFSETHTVTSDADGGVRLLIGDGDEPSGSMDEVDWAKHQYYLKIEMDPENGSNFSQMGTQQLVSVPYAMHAGTVNMPLKNMEILEGSGQDPEEALFEVKRVDGSTVFAVYNEGVRIYVDDSGGKGVKGGFAVGGYSTTNKGYSNEFFRVTPDSVRVYINQDKAKGVKGGFAVGGYTTTNKDVPIDFMQLTPENYFIGHSAGVSNTTGLHNTFFGYESGIGNTTGSKNIFLGHGSGFSNTGGNNNVFIGNEAGFYNDTSKLNVFIGNMSGYWTTSGEENVFIGNESGHNNTEGYQNTMIGGVTGWNNKKGYRNTFLGIHSGNENISGNENVENSAEGQNNALIYGNFETDSLVLNAEVHIRDALQLQPRIDAPDDPKPGTMYFDGNDKILKVWDGEQWHFLW